MKKAIRLLSICAIAAALTAAWTVCAWAETEADPMAPVDTPAAAPSGTVYTVGTDGGAAAVTTVDYTAEGADSGVVLGGGSGCYYGLQITGADSGVTIDGAESVYIGSSNGSLPLYNGRGAVSGIVWGGCRQAALDCGVGILVNGDIAGTVLVEDGTSFTCRDAVLLCTAGSGSFCFRNARLSSEAGVLADLGAEAGDVQLRFENGSYSGSLVNNGEGVLSVSVGHGALLFGDTVQSGGPVRVTVEAGAVWAAADSACVERLVIEEGATVYGALTENEDGTLALTASDGILEAGTYQAQPVAATLPVGHGPALPGEEEAPDTDAEVDADAEEAPAPEEPAEDAQPANKLFPLQPAAGAEEEPQDEVQPEEPAQEPEDADADTAPEDADEAEVDNDAEQEDESGYDARMFPLKPAEPAPAEEPTADEDQEPEQDAQEQQDAPEEEADEADEGQLTVRRSLLAGTALALPAGNSAPIETLPSSVELAAQLAAHTGGQVPAATLLKAGVKTHSFLPEALDNRAIILYNPYCCSAA